MEGESAREEVDALENGAEKVGKFANDKIDKALANSEKFNKAVDNASNKLKNMSDKRNDKKNALKQKANDSKVGKSVNSAVDGVKNSAAGKAAGKIADKAGQLGINPKEMAKGAVGNLVSGPQMDESKSAGEIINETEKGFKKAMELVKDTAKAAATGDPVAIAKVATALIKAALIVLVIVLAFFALIVSSVIHLMGNVLSSALTHISEAFDVVANKLNPTEIESFTMEDQYAMLAVAFGESVMSAYKELEEEVLQEIDNYDADPAYNEWTDILDYNKSISKIEYDSIVERENETKGASDIGMPQDRMREMVKVYIGGYTGIHTDDEFEENSKKLGRYDLGLYKKGTTVFATGEEPYFDLDKVRDVVRTEAAYAAISDMAYLVSGYSVSMNENPILEMGKDVRQLQYNLTVISYKIDIQQRILQQTLDTTAELFANGDWFNAGKNFLSYVFNGEETYFKYSPDLIQEISETASRWVYEYHQGIETNCFDYEFTYEIDYDDKDGNSHSKTVTVTYPRSSDIARVTRTSYDRPDAAEFESSAKSKLPEGAKNISITSSSESRSNEIWVNRSGYDLTEKFYDSWTLEIPMEAFDVDRMMKALFETSVYWPEIDGYYTDREATYSLVPGETAGYNPIYIDQASGQDEILNYYGKYIDKWKYAYYDMEIDYGSSPAGVVSYAEGDQFENGIDKQPYFQYDDVYFYDCNCSPSYGVTGFCQKCGTHGLKLSNEISADIEDGETTQGWGERVLSQMNSPLVGDNAYFRFFDMVFTGNMVSDLMRDQNKDIKQNLMVVRTTSDKLVLDNYTGEQVGGSYQPKYQDMAGEVVLETTNEKGETFEYYPITVEDRILELKDSAMNVLENSDYIQNLLAKAGLTYSERRRTDTLNWKELLNQYYYEYNCGCTPSTGMTERCPNCGKKGTLVYGTQAVDATGVADYIKGKVPAGGTTDISFAADGSILIGSYGWGGSLASKIVNETIKANPDKFQELLDSNGLTRREFDTNWQNLNKGNFESGVSKTAVQNVLSGILSESASIQNDMFNKRVLEVTDYLQNHCNITDPGTIALVGSVIMQMSLDDITEIGRKGDLASFNQDVLIGGITAGTDNSLETTYNNLVKWANSGNKYCTPGIKSSLQSTYEQIADDREAGNLPWISTGIVPENMTEMIEFLKQLCTFCKAHENDITKQYVHYSQGRASDAPYPRMQNQELLDGMEGFLATGQVYFSSDCSMFVHSIFWKLGYQTPTSSYEWAHGRQYAGRTDWSNIQPGDVVVWRTSSGGHVELYTGPGAQESIGFGGDYPKVHATWSWHDNHYGASTRKFYRVFN